MKKDCFTFRSTLTVSANGGIDNKAVQELFSGFTLNQSRLTVRPIPGFAIVTEGMTPPELPEGKNFRVSVRNDGIAVAAKDYGNLVRAWITVMLKTETVDCRDGEYQFGIPVQDYCDQYAVSKRMIHLCVFPETSLSMLQRLIRLCAVCQYTHICLEFWGMLKFDFCEALAWENAYTKDQIRPLIREMRELGVEPIPMFNSFGHASGSRVISGKHVVLDRFPQYRYLYTPDGWAYDVFCDKVPGFLKQVRSELYELFGETEFIHIGCDENYQKDPEYMTRARKFLRDLCDEINAEHRTPILWGDMMLYRDWFDKSEIYYCSAETEESAKGLLECLPGNIVIADWEYEVKNAPVKTSEYFVREGRRTLGCPWNTPGALDAFLQTENLFGIMITTWHSLGQFMPQVIEYALKMGAEAPFESGKSNRFTETAALFRKISSGMDLNYDDFGWMEKQYFIPAI